MINICFKFEGKIQNNSKVLAFTRNQKADLQRNKTIILPSVRGGGEDIIILNRLGEALILGFYAIDTCVRYYTE